jgi:small subunit ribosomal protein S8
MTMTDPIADMLTRIRNSNTAFHNETSMPASKTLVEIARILTDEGYIESYAVEKSEPVDTLTLRLKYGPSRRRTISGLKRISKPGLRVYAKKDELPRVLGGLGIAIVSTSSGMMTNRKARSAGVGGEIVAYVW